MKKIISILISSVMILGIMSGCTDVDSSYSGSADLTSMSVEGNGISVENNTVKIIKGGDYEISGKTEDCMIYVDTNSSVNLILNCIDIKNPIGPAIFINDAEKTTITLADGTQNFIEDGKSYVTEEYDAALFSNDNVEITGSGSLTIKANCMHGIASDDGLIISNGKIIVNSYEHGIKANDKLEIKNGDITVISETGKCIRSQEEIVINGGKIDMTSLSDEGIESEGLLTINDGDIKISSRDDAINTSLTDEEKEAAEDEPKPPRMEKGERPTQKPSGTPPMEFFNKIDEDTARAHALTINGGKIHIETEGDGIDSNGSLTINGGEVIIDGPVGYDNGSLDSDGEMIISGGTVLCTSSDGMMQLPRESKLCTTRIRLSEKTYANTKIEIKSKDGEVVYTHIPTFEFELIAFVSDKLIEGKEYKVFLNDEEQSTFTAAKEVFFGKRP